MNCIETLTFISRNWNGRRASRFGVATGLCMLFSLLLSVGCSSEKGDKEPTVSVQVAPVEKTTMERTVTTQAVLFPLQQAAITPKISAPVQKFLVRRGSRVREGELLAVLE